MEHSGTVQYVPLQKDNEIRQFFHVPRFLHFGDNRNKLDKTDNSYDNVKNENNL
jgi:hypothetical protein